MEYLTLYAWAKYSLGEALTILEGKVNDALKKGYKPQGGVSIIFEQGNSNAIDSASKFYATQAMVRHIK